MTKRAAYECCAGAWHAADEDERHLAVVRVGAVLGVVRVLDLFTQHHLRAGRRAEATRQARDEEDEPDEQDAVEEHPSEAKPLHPLLQHRPTAARGRASGDEQRRTRTDGQVSRTRNKC